MPRLRLQTHGLFADPRPTLRHNIFGQFGVFGRVKHIHSAPQNRNRSGFECGKMRRCVDPTRHAGGDKKSRLSETRGQGTRHATTEGRCVARPDQRDLGLCQDIGGTD